GRLPKIGQVAVRAALVLRRAGKVAGGWGAAPPTQQLGQRLQPVHPPQPARLAPRQPPRRQPQPPRHVPQVAAHEHAVVIAHQRDAAEAVGFEGLDFGGGAGHGGIVGTGDWGLGTGVGGFLQLRYDERAWWDSAEARGFRRSCRGSVVALPLPLPLPLPLNLILIFAETARAARCARPPHPPSAPSPVNW